MYLISDNKEDTYLLNGFKQTPLPIYIVLLIW